MHLVTILIVLLIFSCDIFHTLFFFLCLIVFGGLYIRAIEFFNWLIFLIYIFFIGGLMISFVYMLSLTPNWRVDYVSKFILIFSVFICFSDRELNKIHISLDPQLTEKIGFTVNLTYCNFTLIMFLFLICILYCLDVIICYVKGFLRS